MKGSVYQTRDPRPDSESPNILNTERALLRHSSGLCFPVSLTKSTTTTTFSSPLRSLFFKSRTRFLNPLSSSSSPSSSSSSLSPLSTKANENDKVGDSNGSPAPELCLYNTMSRAKDLFRPRVSGRVGMYVCGVTAYDFSHIGHARVYVTVDVLCRYLQHLNYEVFYVLNFPDVDDKIDNFIGGVCFELQLVKLQVIIARANELEVHILSLSSFFCDEFHAYMAYLHCLPPSVEPRISEHMDQITDMIK